MISVLGKKYEIYTNLTVMTLLDLELSLIITQAELCLKNCIFKSKFHVCYNFFRYENPRKKNFANPFCTKHHKIISWNKKWHNFYFQTSLWCLRKVSYFWGTEKKCENKKFVIFPLIPLRPQGLRLHFV